MVFKDVSLFRLRFMSPSFYLINSQNLVARLP